MQNQSYNKSTSYGGLNDFTVPPPFLDRSDSYDYSSLYSNFHPNPSPFPLSPSSAYSTAGDVPVVVDYNQFLDLSPFQDLIDRRNWCLTQLQTAANDAEALRQENINLQMTNIELSRRLNLMPQASFVNNYFPPPSPSDSAAVPLPSIADSFHRLKIAEKVARARRAWNEGSNAASAVVDNPIEKINYFPPPPPSDYAAVPLPSIAGSFRRLKIAEKVARDRRAWSEGRNAANEVVDNPVEKIGVDRVKLPKSISIRSNDYLKTAQGSEFTGGRDRVPNRSKSAAEAQRVYVRGGKEEEEPMELHVFNQGMSKTELCNKWQKTGACPYGEHCQFAHGIGELRPVLRHPRYKTEVCRMVLAGDHCPYGHRCHFRHSLTEEEKLVGQRMNPRRSLKM